MLDTAAQTATPAAPPVLPVIVLHEAAEALIAADDDGAGGPHRYADIQRLLAAALATRATATEEVAFRLALLRETLVREEASDFAVCLLEAIAADLAHLIGALGPRA